MRSMYASRVRSPWKCEGNTKRQTATDSNCNQHEAVLTKRNLSCIDDRKEEDDDGTSQVVFEGWCQYYQPSWFSSLLFLRLRVCLA